MPVPANPKIYHIVHMDRLPSILADGSLWCDAEIVRLNPPGTTIGMNKIKEQRLRNELSNRPGLHVGEYVPFYFCPRSIMLFLIFMANHPDLSYRGGQAPIVHLECDLRKTIAWAQRKGLRWAFTLSNAGSKYFEDRTSVDVLTEINWDAVRSEKWSGKGVASEIMHDKQAEFLVEHECPWSQVERIGVYSTKYYHDVNKLLAGVAHRPLVEVQQDWYY